jgi:hypothetical protein
MTNLKPLKGERVPLRANSIRICSPPFKAIGYARGGRLEKDTTLPRSFPVISTNARFALLESLSAGETP